MESKISEKLAELDTLLAKSKEDRTRVETARSGVEEVHAKAPRLSNDIKLKAEICEAFGIPSPISNQQITDMCNKSASATSRIFELSKKLLETIDQLTGFISELEEKREQIEKSKTLEELEGISLGTPVVIDSVLLSDADGVKSTWVNAKEKLRRVSRHKEANDS